MFVVLLFPHRCEKLFCCKAIEWRLVENYFSLVHLPIGKTEREGYVEKLLRRADSQSSLTPMRKGGSTILQHSTTHPQPSFLISPEMLFPSLSGILFSINFG
jgi:hypothetical protein